MLRLLRKIGDAGVVAILPDGELLEIYVTRVIGDKKAEISMQFPASIKIMRGEVYDKMIKEKEVYEKI